MPRSRPNRRRTFCATRARVWFFVSSEAQLQKVLSIRGQTALEKLVVMDAVEGADAVRMAEMESDGQASLARSSKTLEATARAVSPDDLATIIYTSGTTGHAQGSDAHAWQHGVESQLFAG